jgi:hypothetical protein
MCRALSRWVVLTAATAWSAVCAAQVAPGDTALKRCIGQRVTRISIEPIGPEFGGQSASSHLLTGLVRKFHVDTRSRVIRQFLQLKEGEICTEIKRRETERVLRAQWFIQDARVLVYPDKDGVQLIVTTVDEVAVIASAGLNGAVLKSASFGSANLMGSGFLIEAGWRSNGALRDGRSLRMRSAITFGRPLQTSVTWNRYGLGNRADIEVKYPFFTDLQRYGFRAILGKDDDYVRFLKPTGDLPFQRVSRSFGSVGGVARIGHPGALLLAGSSLSFDDENVGSAIIVTDSGAKPYGQPLPVLPAPPQNATRLNLLIGGRAMRYLPVEGFDALTGVQDLRIGVQFGGQFGRPLKLSGIGTSDFFASGDVYSGWGTQKIFLGTEWVFSGRKSAAGWDGRLISGRTAVYIKPAKKTTTIVSTEFTGGKDVRVPFQVPLGSTRYGLRGFTDSYDAGGSRFILRGEQRQAIGRPWGFGDVGAVVFGETGRVWAGRVPFGVTTPWRASVGTGMLVSIPPRSRQLYRFDVVYGLNPDSRSHRWEVRLTSGNFTRNFWQDPDESRRARERSLISNLFSF